MTNRRTRRPLPGSLASGPTEGPASRAVRQVASADASERAAGLAHLAATEARRAAGPASTSPEPPR